MLPSTTISLMDSNDAMNIIKLLRSRTERERDRQIHNRAVIRKIIETSATMLDQWREEFSNDDDDDDDDDLAKVANRNSILIPIRAKRIRPIETICKHGRRIKSDMAENQDGKPLKTFNPRNHISLFRLDPVR